MPLMPTVFVSHGSPMFALEPGQVGPRLRALGEALPRPQAVLVVSPHWMTRGASVGLSAQPATVHDFGGFPAELYTLQYPAPGHPAMAERAIALLRDAGWAVGGDAQQGLDHGAWVPLRYLYPQADVPVFQVSLPAGLNAEQAWAYGRALAPLREQGVLIVGSGSLTHNLFEVMRGHAVATDTAYAHAFVDWVRDTLRDGDGARLRRTFSEAPHASRAHPTTEHYLPLLVAAGAAGEGVAGDLIDGGFTHGVLSMDAFVFEFQLAR